ncbi:MAG: hypothetical protein LBR10_08960 [Prevotellaceae bacterium]|jgi:hypothetical protein|nr:hypothetical protein [Prevotellaceae bacterium]
MKTNNDFRKFGDDSLKGEQVKGKFPGKEKKSIRSIYKEIEEEDEIGYYNFRPKESVEDYFDEDENDEDYDDYDDEEDYDDEDYEDYEDDYR